MGYVDDITKINKLAKELMQHGMASDLDEAVKKAAEMLKGKSDVPAIHSQDLPDYVTHSKAVEPSERMNMSWQDAMAKNNDFIVKEMKATRAALEEFKAQIGSLHAELQSLKSSSRQTQSYVAPEQKREAPPIQAAAPKASAAANQRQGTYKPEDVAIDKMFYFGKK